MTWNQRASLSGLGKLLASASMNRFSYTQMGVITLWDWQLLWD